MDVSTHFLTSDTASLYFLTLVQLQNSERNPVSGGGGKCTGLEKFNKHYHLFRKRYEMGHINYGTFIRSHRWSIDLCRFQWPRV